MARFSSLWRNLVHRDRVERDLDDEIRTAFELLVDENIGRGMRPEDARRAATLALTPIETIKDRVRDVRAGALADTILQDLRYAAASAQSAVCLDRGAVDRHRDRREHDDFFCRQRAAVPGAGRRGRSRSSG